MTLSLDILAARMRQGESIPLGDTARVAVALSVPAILQQLVVTAMEYIDAAMVGHIGAEATAAIGIVSSSTWLLHGILVKIHRSIACGGDDHVFCHPDRAVSRGRPPG